MLSAQLGVDRREDQLVISDGEDRLCALLTTQSPTSMTREDFSYESARLRALRNLTKAAVVPAVVLASLVRVTKVQLGYYTIPCYGLCIFLGSYLQGLYQSFQLGRDAKQLAEGRGPVGSIPM